MSAWYFFISLLALIGISGWGLYRDKQNILEKRGNARNQFRFFFATGVLISATILFIPIHKEKLAGAGIYWLQVPVASLIKAMQLFALNVDYKELPWTGGLFYTGGWAGAACTALLTLEFVLAPMLSFTIVLSMFRNVYAWFRCNVLFRQNTYVFSELNERSLVLAKSIQKRDKHANVIQIRMTERDLELKQVPVSFFVKKFQEKS